MIGEVYRVTNKKNGKIYIGITIQGFWTRWLHHLYEARSGSQFPIHRAIRKYGEENFQIESIEVIEEGDYDDLQNKEIFWIALFDSYNDRNGYNATLGGDGGFGMKHSDETKEKIRQKALGRVVTEEAKLKMSKSHKNRDYDTDEMARRARLGNSKRWSKEGEREKASLTNAGNRTILKCDKEGNVIEEFRSISEAARVIGKSRQSLSKCVTGNAKSAYGFIWKYKEIKTD